MKRDYAELAGREIGAVTASWHKGRVLDVYPVMQELALRITVATRWRLVPASTRAPPEVAGAALSPDLLVMTPRPRADHRPA
ncbi:hypothetical protein ABT154_28175 [Streptomyces sp. NPDC001728]|uniref:hypothetical protein n=1 Tax=Streptomyces sp. NPDC001728 TaxID=3154396 RepID=UPI0033253780